MRPFDVGQIKEADIVALVQARTPEGRQLEFKSQLPGRAEAERKEFLADVASFANGQGGVILYGISTSRDEPRR